MAHAEIPQEELKPLIDSMKKVFDPLIKAMPTLALIPKEISRISDNLEQDMMSGVPERIESVAEQFGESFGGKMLKIMKDNAKDDKKLKKGIEDIIKKQADRESNLQNLRDKGLAVEMKNNRVKFLSDKDLAEKQKINLKTQTIIIKKEKELEKLVKKGEKGSEDKIAELINQISTLQKKESDQSVVLGDKKKQPSGLRAGAEEFLPAPIMSAFDDFATNITEVGNTVASFAKPVVGLFKLFTGQYKVLEKIQKLNVKKFALEVKAFAIAKAKFALDMLSVLTNPYALIAGAIAIAVTAIYAFKDEIYNFIVGIGESISNFGKSIYNAFAGSAIGRFLDMEKYDMGEEKETPAQIEQKNVDKNIEAAGPLGALAEARETGTEKLDRLKGEASQMAQDKLASTIVNIANSNQSQTSLNAEVKAPKSTADNALALNPV